MVDSLTLFFIIFMILGLVVTVLLLVRAYITLQKKLLTLTRQKQYAQSQESQQTEQVLMDAHDRAIIIIDEANKKASDIITQAKEIDKENENILNHTVSDAARLHSEELKKASAELLTIYKNAITSIQKDNINTAGNITKDIEAIAKEELSHFKDVLSKETIESEKIVEKKLNQEYQEIEGQLTKYKEERLKEIDGEILQIVQNVTEVVLHKQLSSDDQQQQVLEALTEAKKQAKL